MVLSLLFIEGATRVLVGTGVLSHRVYPTHREPQFWAYVDPVIGMWKHPNATFRHANACFDVTYKSNSQGARDVERASRSPAGRRVVVLGDSFIEGWGVVDQERLTNRLEARTGIEHLNFGASGHFSVVQEWLLYDTYAQKYDHTDVFLFILPFNDYRDNHPDEFRDDLYRPFLTRQGDQLEVVYTVPFEDRATLDRNVFSMLQNGFDNHVYLSNVLRQGFGRVNTVRPSRKSENAESFYDDFSEEDLNALLHSLNRISEIAGDRSFHIFTIPVEKDLDYAELHGTDFALTEALRRFADDHENTAFHDLASAFMKHAEERGLNPSDYTLGCDMHWNGLGNQVAADAVSRIVYGATGP